MVSTDDCELWALALSVKGYGRIQVKTDTGWQMRQAHRVLYEAKYGELPKHLVIDHLCRNKACIKLEHLEPVTNAENIKRGEFKRIKVTHCAQGHKYTAENTLVVKPSSQRGLTKRRCRTCNSLWNAQQYQRRRLKLGL